VGGGRCARKPAMLSVISLSRVASRRSVTALRRFVVGEEQLPRLRSKRPARRCRRRVLIFDKNIRG